MRKILLILLMAASVFASSDIQKVKYMGTVKDIVISTQKIRGGTYNFLNGSEFAQFGVFEERSKQKKAFKSLDRQFNVAGKKIDAEFDKLRNQTRSLNKMAFQLDPLTSFKAYSTLVKKMIESDQGVQKQFFGKADPFVKSISSIMVNDLLPLSDGIGKLRGLGSGIIARTYCEDDEEEMMNGYVEEIKNNLSKTIGDLQTLNKKYGSKLPAKFNNKLSALQKDVSRYIAFAENKVIGKEDIDEDPNQYFDDGTALIKKVMELYKISENALKKAL